MKNIIFILLGVAFACSIAYLINNKQTTPVESQISNGKSITNITNLSNTQTKASKTIQTAENNIPSNEVSLNEQGLTTQKNPSSQKNISSITTSNSVATKNIGHDFQKGWDQNDYQNYLDYLNKSYGLHKTPKSKNSLIRNITSLEHTQFVGFAREVLRDEQAIQSYLNNLKLIEDKSNPNYKSTLIRQAKEKLAYQIIQDLSRINSIAELH